MVAKRRLDWQSRLQALIERERTLPFDDCSAHCGLFAADVVKALTGDDPVSAWRLKPQARAMAHLRRAGFVDHVDFAASLLPEVPPSAARDGDLVIIPTEGGPAFGVLLGAVVVVRSPDSLATVSRMMAVRAFAIG